MNYRPIWLTFVAIIALYILIIYLGVFRKLQAFPRRVWAVLTVVESLVAALYLSGWLSSVPFIGWSLDLNAEKNAAALFSATQLSVVGLVALYNGLASSITVPKRLYWIVMGAIFLFLGVDEYYMLHEPLQNWKCLYIILGGLMVAGSLGVFWFFMPQEQLLLGLLIGGLGTMAAGGIVLEAVSAVYGCWDFIGNQACYRLLGIEEFLELAGTTLVLVGFLHYTSRHVKQKSWVPAKRGLFCGLVLWTLWLNAQRWLIPHCEVAWWANPVAVTYPDHALTLIGYRISPESITIKDDQLRVTLYWRADRLLEHEYGVSVHLLGYPDVKSVAQNDVLMLNPPHPHWLPGMVVRQDVMVTLPTAAISSGDYWVTVTLWQCPWYEFNRIAVSESDCDLATSDTVILADLSLYKD